MKILKLKQKLPLTELSQNSTLQTLIALTNERESGAVESALSQATCLLFNCKNVQVYTSGKIKRCLFPGNNAAESGAIEGIDYPLLTELNHCLESNKAQVATLGNNHFFLFPQHNFKLQVCAIIAIEANQDFNSLETLSAFLKIYENFIALMHENQQDTLTGLLNRKTFDSQVNNIIAGIIENENQPDQPAQSESMSTYLAVFDIDHFKHVNDQFGHLMGDEVLLTFSQIMGRSFREQDLLFRFGGEEFIGIFHCPSDETMLMVLNRFRTNIESHRFPTSEKVTVSIGFTLIHAGDLASHVIDRSDVALYHAKNNGRNQVCQHEQLVLAGQVTTQDNSGDIELF